MKVPSRRRGNEWNQTKMVFTNGSASMKGPSRRRGNTFVSELNAIAAAPQ